MPGAFPARAFAACWSNFLGLLDQPKPDCIAASIAAGKSFALVNHYGMRPAVCPVRNLISAAVGADVARLQFWSEIGAFHGNPRIGPAEGKGSGEPLPAAVVELDGSPRIHGCPRSGSFCPNLKPNSAEACDSRT